MNDLISREQAIALIEEWRQFALGHNEYGEKLAGCIKSGVEKITSAEKTGKWIDNETSYADGVNQTCTCSICGRRSERPLGDFCRWCGARMEEE